MEFAQFATSPPFESLVECRVEATSWDIASKVWFSTPPITQAFLDHLETIQLKTLSHNDNPEVTKEDLQYSWFELVIYRSWDRFKPRINLATQEEFVWRSHSNVEFLSEDGTELLGPVFGRNNEMFKELEAGDVISVRICSRCRMSVNHGIKGELIVKFRNKSSPIVPTTHSVYPYSSVGPCYVNSVDHQTVSKIWFSTPPLNKNTIEKLSEIQLFTESRDQGWADDTSASYSWFELVILENPNDKFPRKQDNFELAWRSHDNRVGDRIPSLVPGKIFGVTHELRNLLSDGNSIGIRVAARFQLWRNLATEGRLELRFSEPVAQEKPVKTAEAAQIALTNEEFLKRLMQMYHKWQNNGPEISQVVFDRIQEPMQWSGDYGFDQHPLRILSFDGGGVRGLSSLLILREIMKHVKGVKGEALEPYQCFDLIAGTSTGGLIAIMLGRLQMSVGACIKEYEDLAKKVFGKGSVNRHQGMMKYLDQGFNIVTKKIPKAMKLVAYSYMYDATKLKNVIEDVVKRYASGEDASNAKMFDESSNCRVAVFACHSKDVSNTQAKHFRTYPFEDDDSSKYKIWEAARATTAAPSYFERIKVGEEDYVDGGLQVNNPVIQAVAEGMAAFGKARTIGCLLSIGTGLPPPMALRDNSGIGGNVRSLTNLAGTLFSLATNSQLAHLNIDELNQTKRLSNEYFRFNASVDIPPADDPDFSNKIIELDDVGRLEDFKHFTEIYLKVPVVQEKIRECATNLSALHRQNHLAS